MAYLLPFAISLSACFGLQTWALTMSGCTTTKSESNFHTSLGRIQAGVAFPKPKIFLLGSSRTGRMPDRNSGFPGVANLGCDGGNATITLRAIERGTLPTPNIIVIEGDTLLHAIGPSGEEVANALSSWWFRLGTKIPNISSNARPAAIVYSLLLTRKLGGFETAVGPSVPDVSPPEAAHQNVFLDRSASNLVAELSGIIERLKAQGCQFLIIQIPPEAPQDSLNVRIPLALSRATATPYFDLTEILPPASINYTDGIHMAPTSAAAALRSILKALDTL